MSWLIDPQRLIPEGRASNLVLLEASVLKATDANGRRRWVSGRAATPKATPRARVSPTSSTTSPNRAQPPSSRMRALIASPPLLRASA